MNFRTDLAVERREYIGTKTIDGVISTYEHTDGVKVTRIEIIDENGEKLLEKPQGKYITLEIPPFTGYTELGGSEVEVLSQELRKLLPKYGTVLVAGLGNDQITPDALGPKCVNYILASRHINKELAEKIGLEGLRSVAAIIPGVLGKTGIETSEIIEGTVRKIKPSAVIAVDSLASRRLERLGATVQLSDSGISPGSGIGNRRTAIDRGSLGVPVIAVGVPTVVDAATMAMDILENSGSLDEKAKKKIYDSDQGKMMVTPKEIDLVIERAAKFIAMGINLALQPQLEAEEILEIVG
ncbi:MAG: GPR endopeptidase [Acutalibacteraceae bacterium]